MDNSAKQKIVEKIKDSSNILVTVSRNPSVDELSAALGLTVLLNKMKKHATAVFSGNIPPAITFLDPEKTFEATVDSLRDFIIALDKEKADHLRYKVEGDVVKIFITPYRTTITGDDLEFSQGDYNVELVLGLGVKNQDDLDQALTAHGRILHDATVATVTVGDTTSELGSIDWHEQNASSLSETLVSLSDSLKGDKTLLDEQIATAFLTGVVAATDRFSNNKTSSKVMTVAAQLMSAGANQQLIASKLEEAHEIGPGASSDQNPDGTTDLSEGESTKLGAPKEVQKKKPAETAENDGSLTISHEKEGTLEEVASAVESEKQAAAKEEAEAQLAEQTAQATTPEAQAAEQNLAQQLATVAPATSTATPSVADLQKDLAAASEEVSQAAQAGPALSGAVSTSEWKDRPAMGGTLNATTEQAQEDKQREIENERNHTILTHGNGNNYVGNSSPVFQSPLNGVGQSEDDAPVDPFAQITPPAPTDTAPTAYAPPVQPPSETLADIDAQNREPHEEARAAIDAAFNATPPPAPTVPSAPVFTPLSPQEPSIAPITPLAPPAPQPAAQAATPAPGALPPLPPMPDFSTLPPLPDAPSAPPSGALPPEKLEEVLGTAPAPVAPPSQPNDPGQFKIPGQSF